MINCYKFGCLQPTAGFDQDAIEHLFLRNKLWNTLVALDHQFRQRYRDLMLNSDEKLKSVQDSIDSINQEIEDLVENKKKLRQKERTKNIDSKLLDERINVLKAKRKSLSVDSKIERERVKVEIKPQIDLLNTERYEAKKLAYKESGLWWGNYETVIAAYDIASQKAMKSNSELRFKSFDGSGKFAVRFEDGGLTIDELKAGTSNTCRIETLDTSAFQNLSQRGIKSKARHSMTMTIYTFNDEKGKKQRKEITVPIIFHREMEEGKIKTIHLQRKRLGNQFTWSASFTLKNDTEPANVADHPTTASCGIDLGYRLVKDGLRVATVADSQSNVEYLVLPKSWIDRMDYTESLQSELSEAMTLMWAKLKAEIAKIPEYPEVVAEIIKNMQKMGDRLPYKGIKRLYRVLKEQDVTGSPVAGFNTVLDILKVWDKATYRQELEMVNLKDKLLKQREHIYRNFAASLTKKYAHIVVEDMGLAELAKTEKSETETNDMPNAVKANRQRASLYSLVEAIRLSAIKAGSYFEKSKAAYSSMTCHVCGHLNPKTQNIHQTCESCTSMYDVDENAAKNFLKGEYIKEKVLKQG